MTTSKGKLYTLLLLACTTGYIWLYWGLNGAQQHSIGLCLIKQLTNIPCPSCGSTRAILSLLHGNIAASLYLNPFGLIVAVILLFVPIWIAIDLVAQKATLYRFYHQIDKTLKKPLYAVPLVLLVVINWIWNITKGL
jgi:hypothetical protein